MKGSAEEIASLEIAQTYAFEFPQTLSPIPPRGRAAPDRALRGASSGIAQPGLLHVDGRLAYDPYANQVTATTRHGGRALGGELRQRQLVRQPPGRRRRRGQFFNSDQLRFSGGIDLGQYFRFDASVAYDAAPNLVQEDRGC